MNEKEAINSCKVKEDAMEEMSFEIDPEGQGL